MLLLGSPSLEAALPEPVVVDEIVVNWKIF